ncbi:hypothetical protein HK104_005018 [Borealophlyctis nickersoniae]|nr:hypothetical protein HK104_005018 [Borealophlyctis nickersoniae]
MSCLVPEKRAGQRKEGHITDRSFAPNVGYLNGTPRKDVPVKAALASCLGVFDRRALCKESMDMIDVDKTQMIRTKKPEAEKPMEELRTEDLFLVCFSSLGSSPPSAAAGSAGVDAEGELVRDDLVAWEDDMAALKNDNLGAGAATGFLVGLDGVGDGFAATGDGEGMGADVLRGGKPNPGGGGGGGEAAVVVPISVAIPARKSTAREPRRNKKARKHKERAAPENRETQEGQKTL